MKALGLTFTWLADQLGVNKSSTTRWAQNGVPAERVLEVERLTGISRQNIRPDLYPTEDFCFPSPPVTEEATEGAAQ